MRILRGIILGILWLGSLHATGQDISTTDREKLRQAEKVADEFVDKFRQTLDFGSVWREFRAQQFSCRLVKSDLVTSVSDEEKIKMGTALLEKAYIAVMNYYYFKGAHDLSVARMDSGKTEDQITPKEILKAEHSFVYAKTNGKSPKTISDIEESIVELNRLAKLYLKYLPRDVMRSASWTANAKYLASRGGVTHLGVNTGNSDFCIAADVKYFIVDRGLFYFYMVEENGKIKILEFAVGD